MSLLTLSKAGCAGIIALSLFSCAVIENGVRPAQYSKRLEAGLSPADRDRIESNCPFGMPKPEPKWNHGPSRLIARDGYVLQHSSIDKIPLWVCEQLQPAQLIGDLERTNPFQPDPLLKGFPRAELGDYRGSGFDRGHQAPAGDQTTDDRLKAETFYLSNMAPQEPSLNRQIWKELEAMTRGWVKDGHVKRAKIITGPMFYDPSEDNTETADGLINYRTIGTNKVAVPTHFYKIIVTEGQNGDWNAVAFVMENHGYPDPYDFAKFILSVDWIEERTGLDFMPDLDNPEEQRLESKPGHLVNH